MNEHELMASWYHWVPTSAAKTSIEHSRCLLFPSLFEEKNIRIHWYTCWHDSKGIQDLQRKFQKAGFLSSKHWSKMLAPLRFQLTTNKDCGMARKVGKGVLTIRETGSLPKQCSGQISLLMSLIRNRHLFHYSFHTMELLSGWFTPRYPLKRSWNWSRW